MKMQKTFLGFLLSGFSIVLLFFPGEPLTYYFGDTGFIATFVIITAYFFVCQFFLSRGNPNAFRKDWPVMLSLRAGPILIALITNLAG
jgi:hypothetical protein